MKVLIDPNKSIYENAAEYFDAAKKLKKKAEDTEKAIKQSEKELVNVEKELLEKTERKKGSESLISPKQWYHQFHWFFTSESLIAIGGKEAKQNELIVKKNLKENDLFFHADIHGASAVVLKDGKTKASEKSLKETAQFAGCYSSAWRARLPSVDVYAVGKDQVSTAALTGEYLAKGSFLITGKKQYFKDVEMMMFLGKNKEGQLKIVPSSVGDAGLSTYYELIPGKKEKEEIAKELAEEFGSGIKADSIAVLLPGRCEIRKIR